MVKQQSQDLIICQRCGNEHGPSEAKHIVRFTCGHCGQSTDSKNYESPVTWSNVMQGNVIRYSLCPACTALHDQWLTAVDPKG